MVSQASTFVDYYRSHIETYRAAADRLSVLLRELTKGIGVPIHLVTAREKSVRAVREKIREKAYSDPAHELTDLVGARIITYFVDDVDAVVSFLKAEFEVDPIKSVNKRAMLGLREFGYASVHIIAKLTGSRSRSAEYACLRDLAFEIQVRSILEHSWAEIEHEIVYKSGVDYTADVKRRFASLAAFIEAADSQFTQLRVEKQLLIDRYVELYRERSNLHDELDVARMLACVSTHAPANPLAERISVDALPLVFKACLGVLRDVGVNTPRKLLTALNSRKVREKSEVFAANNGIPPERVSGLALLCFVIEGRNRKIFRDRLPEFAADESFM